MMFILKEGSPMMFIKVSEKTQNVPKKFCSLKSWFCGFIGDDIFWNFENWSIRTLWKCVSFLPPSVGRNVVVTVCTGTDSQPVAACRFKLISAGL